MSQESYEVAHMCYSSRSRRNDSEDGRCRPRAEGDGAEAEGTVQGQWGCCAGVGGDGSVHPEGGDRATEGYSQVLKPKGIFLVGF